MFKRKTISIVFSLLMVLTMFNIYPYQKTSAYDYLSRGIDVSAYQKEINWDAVVNDGISFAIIRAGYGNANAFPEQKDKYFDYNLTNAKRVGIKCGVYWFCYATSVEAAYEEADSCYNIIKGIDLELPVYLDVEDEKNHVLINAFGKNKTKITEMALAFCNRLSSYGIRVGVYANRDWFTNYIDKAQIENSGYEIWLAQYPSGEYAITPDNYDKSSECGIWQYSSKGSVAGINGYVDVDVAYKEWIPYDDWDTSTAGQYTTKNVNTNLNIRSSPNTSSVVVGKVPAGATVNVIKTKGSWAYIEYNGTNGYCSLDYLERLVPVTTTTETTTTTSPITMWYDELVPEDIGESLDAVILVKEPWLPIREYDNANVALHKEEGISSEMWRFTKQSDGSYTIQNFKTGKFLAAEELGTVNSTNVVTSEKNGGENQKWFLYMLNDGYVIRAAYTDLVLDVSGGIFENDTNIQLYEKNNTASQVFSLYYEGKNYGNPKIGDVNASVSDNSVFLVFNGYYADKYRIYRSTDKKTWKVIDTVESDSYTDSRLTPLTTYYYKIDYINRFYTGTSEVLSITTGKSSIKGDCNADGSFSIADVVILQNWLLGRDVKLKEWRAADLCKDERLDVFDLCLMKRLLIEEGAL